LPRISVLQEQQRRDQILGAAMRCFARDGYRATSMDDIVRESGLSVGAIYSYFASKEELFSAIAAARVEQQTAYLTELFSRPGPMADHADEAVDFFFSMLHDEEQLPYFRLMFEVWSEAMKSDRLAAHNLDRCAGIRDFHVWLLSEARRRGELRDNVDVEATATVMMALNDGLIMQRVCGVEHVDPDALRAAYVSLLNFGLSNPQQAFLRRPTAGLAPGAATPAVSSTSNLADRRPRGDTDGERAS
jgi:AcrR family transcriptional regulator